ncbi:hypothetical protein NIES2134_114490 [Thermostichus vulcanus NIES-2134]|nr:hypothetical protein NIES2134_114490 [Thermostichus vulcanus NIES-2134]
MTTIPLRTPEDGVEDCKRVDPLLSFAQYQPPVPADRGQGLPSDLEPLKKDATLSVLILY